MKPTQKEALEEIRLLEEDIKFRECLPHLYSFKKYQWGKDFSESRNKICVICSSNQVGKSTEQICKIIEWATNKSLWPSLWKNEPRVFFLFLSI